MAKPRSRKSEQRLNEVRRALGEGRVQDAWSSARGLLATHKHDAGVLGLAGVACFMPSRRSTRAFCLRGKAIPSMRSSGSQRRLSVTVSMLPPRLGLAMRSRTRAIF